MKPAELADGHRNGENCRCSPVGGTAARGVVVFENELGIRISVSSFAPPPASIFLAMVGRVGLGSFAYSSLGFLTFSAFWTSFAEAMEMTECLTLQMSSSGSLQRRRISS